MNENTSSSSRAFEFLFPQVYCNPVPSLGAKGSSSGNSNILSGGNRKANSSDTETSLVGGEHEDDYEDLPATASTLTHLTAGALAGILEHTVAFPLDLIKTRMQVIRLGGSASVETHQYTGTIDAIRKISNTEGMKKLWRGVSSVILGAGPAHAIFYASYESTKFFLTQNHHSHDFIATSVSGMTAAALADAFMNPFDVIKQRMQVAVNSQNHQSMLACARNIWAKEGLGAFYVSYPTTLLLSVPFNAVQFSAYERIKHFLNPTHKYDPISHIVSGGMAGAFAAAITTPLDVMKTVLQTRSLSSDPLVQKASGIRDAAALVYRHHGLAGFMRGVQPRVLSYVPSTAICWTVYEYFKYILGYNYKKNQK